jgi:hypothetical protein
MIFVGYEPGSAAYRCYNPVTKSVHISRDVIFDEEAMWKWSGDQAAKMEFDVSFGDQFENSQTMQTELGTDDVSGSVITNPIAHDVGGVLIQEEGGGQANSPLQNPRTPAIGGGTPSEPVDEGHHLTPLSCNLDAEHDDAPLRYRQLSDILRPETPPRQACRDIQRELYLATGEEPTTFSQAEQETSWRHAMAEEIKSIEDNNTWVLVDMPVGHRPIGLKWVYKLKKDATGAVVKHKARLVAKGYV